MKKKERLIILKKYLEDGISLKKCQKLFKEEYDLDLHLTNVSNKAALVRNERVYKLFDEGKIKFTNAIKTAFSLKNEQISDQISELLEKLEKNEIFERMFMEQLNELILRSRRLENELNLVIFNFEKENESTNFSISLKRNREVAINFGVIDKPEYLKKILTKIKEIDEISD